MRQANLKRAAGINHGLLKAFISAPGMLPPSFPHQLSTGACNERLSDRRHQSPVLASSILELNGSVSATFWNRRHRV